MKKKIVLGLIVCALALCTLAGCSGGSTAKTYDLTKDSPSSDTIKEAFSTENIKTENTITLEGRYETKAYSDGTKAYVIHLYINGEDYYDSVYCDVSKIDASKIPANDTMVVAHGTWKHDSESSNDTSFGFYLDKLEAK